MNNKDFITELSLKSGYSTKDTTQMVSSVLNIMVEQLQEGKMVSLQSFGTFEIKKRLERISVNPTTKQRLLIPPKLALTFKPSYGLKEKFK